MKRLGFIVMCLLALTMTLSAQDDDTIITTRDTAPDAEQFTLVSVIDGLQFPLYATGAGDGSGRLFVLEQSGRIWILENDILVNTPFIDLSGAVSQDVLSGYSERGLLGIAFHPEYAENGLFYVNYTDRSGNTQVVEYSVSADDPNVADLTTARTLLSINQPYANHNGGHMDFGPDGYLYISVGDGGSRDDPLAAGQDPSTLLGTLLRIDVNNPGETRPYGIPEDNPAMSDASLAPEVWAWGLRNVWRFSFDRATGDLYMGDVGQDQYEEINFQPAESTGGENYGWRAYEGFQRYIGAEPTTEVVDPIAVYDHGAGCSVTGGYVYRGEAIPELQGAYLYSDYCQGRLWAAYRDSDNNWQSVEIMPLGRQVSSFGEDDNGEIYVIDYRGAVLRFEPTQ